MGLLSHTFLVMWPTVLNPLNPDVLLSVLLVRVIGVNKILTLVTNQQKYPRCCIYFVTRDEVTEEFWNSITDLVRRFRWIDRECL
jgi:hypothetical protein